MNADDQTALRNLHRTLDAEHWTLRWTLDAELAETPRLPNAGCWTGLGRWTLDGKLLKRWTAGLDSGVLLVVTPISTLPNDAMPAKPKVTFPHT